MGIALDESCRVLAKGRVIVGGSPLRVFRLSAGGIDLIERWRQGVTVGIGISEQKLARTLLDNAMAHPRPANRSSGNPSAQMSDVTVVIPVKDHLEQLKRLLGSAAAFSGAASIVVVDDGSAVPISESDLHIDNSYAGSGDLETRAPEVPVTIVRSVSSSGPAAARMLGAKMVSSNLVAFVDADCVLDPHCLSTLLPQFEDPKVGTAAPRIRALAFPDSHEGHLPDGWSRRAELFESYRSPLDLGDKESPVRPRAKVPYVPSATMMVRKIAFDEVGGFDTSMRFGEDVDLVWRMGERDWSIRYVPEAVAYHEVRRTPKLWLSQRYGYGTSAAPLSDLHGSAVAPIRASKWTIAMWSLIGLGFPIPAAFVAVLSTVLLGRKLKRLPNPVVEAWRIAGKGHAASAEAVLRATRRAWWPIVMLLATRSRTARRLAVASIVFPPIIDYLKLKPKMGLAEWFAFVTADDLAYSAGVWAGCMKTGTLRPLLPAS